MATQIAELLISIGVDAEGAEEAAKKIGKVKDEASEAGKKGGDGLKKFAKSAKIGLAAVGVAAVAAGAALIKLGKEVFSFVNETTASMDRIAKDAAKSGLGTEEFQRLGFAAERSGTNVENLGKATRKLNTQMLDVAQGGGKMFTDTLTDVGLSMADLEGKSATEQLGILGDALNGIDDKAKRAALTAKLLGEEAGPQLATLLAEGSKGLRALTDAATGVIPDESIQSAVAFQDQMTDFDGVLKEVKAELATSLMPIIQKFIKQFKGWIKENQTFIKQDIPKIIKIIAKTMGKLVPIVTDVVEGFNSLVTQIRQLNDDLNQKFGPAWGMIKNSIKAVLFPINAVAGAIGRVIDKITAFISSSKELMKIAAFLGVDMTPRQAKRGMGETPEQRARDDRESLARVNAFLGQEDKESLDRNQMFKTRLATRIMADAAAKGRRFTRSEKRNLANLGFSKSDIRSRERAIRSSRVRGGGGGGGGRAAPQDEAAATVEEAAPVPVELTPIEEFLKSRGIEGALTTRAAELKTADVKPEAIINITNNTFNNDFDIVAPDPEDAGKQVAAAIQEQFDVRLARAGQATAGNVVR